MGLGLRTLIGNPRKEIDQCLRTTMIIPTLAMAIGIVVARCLCHGDSFAVVVVVLAIVLTILAFWPGTDR